MDRILALGAIQASSKEGMLEIMQLSFLGKEYKCCNGCWAISS